MNGSTLVRAVSAESASADRPATSAPPELALAEAVLRGRRSEKWWRVEPHILPADVGEMDFAIAEPIRAAIAQHCDAGEFNALPYANDVLAHAFAARMRARFDWAVDTQRIHAFGDVVQGLYASVMAFSDPEDGVIVMTPTYAPLRDAVLRLERRLLPLPMRDDGGRYTFDVDDLDALLSGGARLLLLCHPHNPTGRVFTHEELTSIAERAIAHDLIVVSDEIHADLVFAEQTYRPFASLGPEIAGRTVTLSSASKSFNLSGLRCALAHFGSAALRQRFEQRVPSALLGDPTPLGVHATVAAWSEGQAWLDAARAQLAACRARLAAQLAARLPEIRWHPPDATYFAWLDCEALQLDMPASEFFRSAARVALSPGEAFDTHADRFVRLNFATSDVLLDAIVERMALALGRVG